MGVVDWLRGETTPSARRAQASLLGGGGVLSVDASTHRGLLALAGYTSAQLPSTITREDALKVPAMSQGVVTLLTVAGMLRLTSSPSDEPRALLDELDPNYAPGYTIARTVDDLLFYGVCWWRVTSRTARDFPRTVERVDPHRVRIDVKAQKIYVDDQEVTGEDMKRFDALAEGLLVRGQEAIGTALANVRQTRTYADNPRGQLVLTDAPGAEPLEPSEARDYIEAYADTMRARGIGYLAGFVTNELGYNANDIQLIPARQIDAVEMARLLAIPSDYCNAPSQGSSLHYANIAEVRRDLIDVGGLAQVLGPIEQRLSMPDMTPRGTTVKFDADSYFLRITPDQPDPEPAPEAAP